MSYSHKNYSMAMNFFNDSQCHVPFDKFDYYFNCYQNMSDSECCTYELNKYNVSDDWGTCLSISNSSFLTYVCRNLSESSKNDTEHLIKMVAIGVAGFIILIFIIYMCCCCNKKRQYNRL